MEYFYNIDGSVVKVDDMDIYIMKEIKKHKELTLFEVFPRTLDMYVKCLRMGQQNLIEVTKLRQNEDKTIDWEVKITSLGRNVLLLE